MKPISSMYFWFGWSNSKIEEYSLYASSVSLTNKGSILCISDFPQSNVLINDNYRYIDLIELPDDCHSKYYKIRAFFIFSSFLSLNHCKIFVKISSINSSLLSEKKFTIQAKPRTKAHNPLEEDAIPALVGKLF